MSALGISPVSAQVVMAIMDTIATPAVSTGGINLFALILLSPHSKCIPYGKSKGLTTAKPLCYPKILNKSSLHRITQSYPSRMVWVRLSIEKIAVLLFLISTT